MMEGLGLTLTVILIAGALLAIAMLVAALCYRVRRGGGADLATPTVRGAVADTTVVGPAVRPIERVAARGLGGGGDVPGGAPPTHIPRSISDPGNPRPKIDGGGGRSGGGGRGRGRGGGGGGAAAGRCSTGSTDAHGRGGGRGGEAGGAIAPANPGRSTGSTIRADENSKAKAAVDRLVARGVTRHAAERAVTAILSGTSGPRVTAARQPPPQRFLLQRASAAARPRSASTSAVSPPVASTTTAQSPRVSGRRRLESVLMAAAATAERGEQHAPSPARHRPRAASYRYQRK